MLAKKRETLLPNSLQGFSGPNVADSSKTALQSGSEIKDKLNAAHNDFLEPIPEDLIQKQNTSKHQPLIKDGSPLQKYWTSYKFDQAGLGWISFDRNPGRQTVLIKSIYTRKGESSILRRTAHDNIVNLIEAFHSNGITHLVYNLDLFDIPLSSVYASPTVQLKEEEIATVCREILKGLRYIHEEFELSHGSISIDSVLLNLAGSIKIANIGEALMLGKNLGYKREDIKSVGLMAIHLKHPHTTLEDSRDVLHSPPNLSGNAKAFVDMTPTATYQQLFQCKFILKAAPTWDLKPHFVAAFPHFSLWRYVKGGSSDW